VTWGRYLSRFLSGKKKIERTPSAHLQSVEKGEKDSPMKTRPGSRRQEFVLLEKEKNENERQSHRDVIRKKKRGRR